jgi:hypothetical protein
MKMGFLKRITFFLKKPLAQKVICDTLFSPYGRYRSERKQAAEKVNVRG